MQNTSVRFGALLLLVAMIPFYGHEASLACRAGETREAETRPVGPAAELLVWLPPDVETVIVANGPLKFRADGGLGKQPFLQSLQSLPMLLVGMLDNGSVAKGLDGLQVEAALEGSRRHTAPLGEGMMRFEGCEVIRFAAPAADALRRVVSAALAAAQKVEETGAGDIKVGVFTAKWGGEECSLFLALPKTNVLLVASDRKFLEEVVARMSPVVLPSTMPVLPERVALPLNLPEWRHVKLDAPMWAVRHFQPDSAEDDPSSPLRAQAGANTPDTKAIGFAFHYDGEMATATYLTNSANALKIASKQWLRPKHKLSPEVEEIANGTVLIRLRVDRSSTEAEARMFLFALLGSLGHAIYL